MAAGSYSHSSLSALCASVTDGRAEAHELPAPLHDLWRDGFRCGNQAAQVRVDRAERAADIYYDLAFNGDEARKRHAEMLKHFDVMESRKRKAVAA